MPPAYSIIDHSYDVVVVGAGGAGLRATLGTTAEGLRTALADYDLRKLESARIGETAPDFALANFAGKTYRLSQFRGRKSVVLRFILYDY